MPVESRYRWVRFHARGGLGEVYVAEDAELHREVALKRIRPEHETHPEATRRFVREAEITARLQHPGIVPVYGLVRDAEGRPCYAMRFVEGESLRAAIDSLHHIRRMHLFRGPSAGALFRSALRGLLPRFITVCQTVAYAHSRGVIHRDLKPENIMLGPFGETLVVDWGLARPFGDGAEATAAGGNPSVGTPAEVDAPGTRAGAVVGTPSFMSPEQAAGDHARVGPASDIYSLGAVLYVLLTGHPPFEGDDLPTLLARIQAGDFSPPRPRNTLTPRALECVCLKAMALLPEQRYRTAQGLAEDIERWLSGEPVTAYREPLLARLTRWERRYQWTVPWVIVILLALVMVSVVGMLILNDSQREAKVKQMQRELESLREQRR
jgi:serine/threonine protein kinase